MYFDNLLGDMPKYPKKSIKWSTFCSTGASRDGCSIVPGCCLLPRGPGGSFRLGGRTPAAHQPPTWRGTP